MPNPHGKPEILELFYAPTPNGWKISILLEEANIPYKLIIFRIYVKFLLKALTFVTPANFIGPI